MVCAKMPILFKLLRKGKKAYWSHLLGSYELMNLCQEYSAHPLRCVKFLASFVNAFSPESK